MNPSNPNKITAIIMIALGFSLIFIIAIAYQAYLNGITESKTLKIVGHNVAATENAIRYLKSAAIRNNITSQNQVILTGILNQLDELNNKTDVLLGELKLKISGGIGSNGL